MPIQRVLVARAPRRSRLAPIRCLQYPFVAEVGCWVHSDLPCAGPSLLLTAWSYPLGNLQRNLQTSHNSPLSCFSRPLGYNGLCLQRTGRFMISPIILSLLVGILGLLGGAVLGLCFRVYVLVLAIMLALVVVAGAGVAAEAGLRWIALDVFVVTMCLQLGYIAGSVFKARRANPARSPTTWVRQSSARR
jgi:hypothetical protein